MQGISALSIVTTIFLTANAVFTIRKAYQEWKDIHPGEFPISTHPFIVWKWVVVWLAIAGGFFILIALKAAQHFELIRLSTTAMVLWGVFMAINISTHLADVYRHKEDTQKAFVFGVVAACFFAIFVVTIVAKAL